MLAASSDNMEGLGSPNTPSKHPDAPKPRIWLGVKEGLIEAKQAIEDKNLTLAEQLLREILEFASAEPEPWHILAAVLNRKGALKEAKACLKRTLIIQETNIELQSDLPVSKRVAKLLWAQNESAAALNMLAELLLAQPEDTELQALQQIWTSS
ncbi:MAG TPA: hypothetical protein EYP39_05945 [Ghiorsea sp.]|nr:hypothetical protein [Ghiorsea sp.]HIP08064.1 hypothetical protein [Mariprofundaceae bacterium]